MLKANVSLQVFWMGLNSIGDDDIATIASALHMSRISELDIMECGITITGAKSLHGSWFITLPEYYFIECAAQFHHCTGSMIGTAISTRQ